MVVVHFPVLGSGYVQHHPLTKHKSKTKQPAEVQGKLDKTFKDENKLAPQQYLGNSI